MLVYVAHANILMLGQVGALQSIKHIDACHIHGETDQDGHTAMIIHTI